MPTVTLQLNGTQIGSYANLSATGNGANRVVTLTDLEAVGTASDLYTVIIEQVNAGVTEFRNGQFITILNPDGTELVPRSVVQPNVEQGRGAGDEHLILKNQNFLIDLGGIPVGPATVTYTEADENAAAGDGDDDGNLDFDDFPCFGPGTLIATPSGDRDVSNLTAGDLIETMDHGPVPVLWVGRRRVDVTACRKRNLCRSSPALLVSRRRNQRRSCRPITGF